MITDDEHVSDDTRPHPVADVLIRRLQQETDMSERSARLAASQVIALTLGWRLNERFLIGSCGLGDEDLSVLRDELHAACLRVVESAGGAPARSTSEPRQSPADAIGTDAAAQGFAMSGAPSAS
jgi:hypothetical protein